MIRLVGLTAAATLVFAGCASEGDATDASAETGVASTSTRRDDGITPLAPPTSRAGDTTTTTTSPACPTPSRFETPTIDISAVDFRFQPACVAMTTNQGINVTNHGTVAHNVTMVIVGQEEVEFLGADLQPGENNATEAFGNQGPGANTYRLFCKFHQDQGMQAFLLVSEAR